MDPASRMAIKKLGQLLNCVSICMVCPTDSTILITADDVDIWLPATTFQEQSVQNILTSEIKEITGGTVLHCDRILRINKYWVPYGSPKYLLHIVCEYKVNAEQKKKMKLTGGKYKGRLKWITETEALKMNSSLLLLSHTLIEYLMMTKNKPAPNPPEAYTVGLLFEFNESLIVTQPTNSYDQVVQSADLNADAQTELWAHFLLYCFPVIYMSRHGFSRFMLQCGQNKNDIPQLFKAANISGTGSLSFKEFLYLVAAMEPKTSHAGVPAEVRCRYIFRFYDVDNDGNWNAEEFKNMVLAMRKLKGMPLDQTSVQNDIDSYYKAFGFSLDTKPLGIAEFLHSIGDAKLRGTSALLRSYESVKTMLAKNKAAIAATSAMAIVPANQPAQSMGAAAKKTKEEPKVYDIGMHSMRLQNMGTVLNVEQVLNIDGAISMTTFKSYSLSDRKRNLSIEIFSQKSLVNEVLKTLRTIVNSPQKVGYSWNNVQVPAFGQNMIQIAKMVREILKEEPRLVELNSPIYVMGDFHGNLNDIINFEKTFWPMGPIFCPAHLLFLGDYVDRGVSSVEVVCYLFCYKIQMAHKMTLIRGNHEIREIQKLFSFPTECVAKFGDKLGQEVWNAVNSAFDVMPLAATIDGKLFCCHGGIPPPWLCPSVAAINQIPCPLLKPDDQSALAWSLMWNDPIRSKQINDHVSMELMANEGFAMNTRRGTAHVFNADALDRFFNVNGFTHLIRGHESAQSGFYFQQKGKVLTVFSASHYCNGTNDAACVLVDQCKLRIFRLEH